MYYIHSAVAVGSRIFVFGGGGASSSNKFLFIELKDSLAHEHDPDMDAAVQVDDTSGSQVVKVARYDDLQPSGAEDLPKQSAAITAPSVRIISHPAARGAKISSPKLPSPRCSALMVRCGRYVIIQGGWSRRTSEVGDFWVRIVMVPSSQASRLQ
jgi:hypothetical protein